MRYVELRLQLKGSTLVRDNANDMLAAAPATVAELIKQTKEATRQAAKISRMEQHQLKLARPWPENHPEFVRIKAMLVTEKLAEWVTGDNCCDSAWLCMCSHI
jgi:hypothetical protein